MLSYMECFSSETAASQSEPVSFAERSSDLCNQIQEMVTKLSSLFSQKHLWTLGS